jgi:spore coat polysaccharide biosynthesis predicted glycosyltransferase SpsG
VIFAAAAGPRRGFGHLVRCGVLADVLGVPRVVVLRGSRRSAAAARRLGWTVCDWRTIWKHAATARLVVVDDPSPSHAARAVRAARDAGLPAASVHDIGLDRAPADLTIDGSLACMSGARPADLQGPEFAILDPILTTIRERRQPRSESRVLVALGGGAHVRAIGTRLAARLRAGAPGAAIDLAAGLVAPKHPPALPAGCQWIAGDRLRAALSTASVAVVGGGLTAYEACVLGTPSVALPVVPAQSITTRALADSGAMLDAGAPTRDRAIDRASRHAIALLNDRRRATRLGRRARTLVDGRGAWRVAARLQELAAQGVVHAG